jgi:uncharacterized protein (TIGR00369 family)
VNPDRALVLEFLAAGRQPLALASNPLAADLGGTLLELDPARGTALLAFEPTARFVQGAGVLQGGIIGAMLDFAMAFAAHARLAGGPEHLHFATATLTVNLLRPAAPGRQLARARIVREGRRVLFADSELAAEDGRVLATASSVLPLAESAEHARDR